MCLSIRMQQLGCHWTDFHEIWQFITSHKSVGKLQISSKPDKNYGYFTRRQNTLKTVSLRILPRTGIFYTKAVENSKTLHICSINFPQRSCCWRGHVEKRGRNRQSDDNIIRRTRIACWITKATDTHSEYATFIAFPTAKWLRERASVLRLYI